MRIHSPAIAIPTTYPYQSDAPVNVVHSSTTTPASEPPAMATAAPAHR